MNVYKTLLEQMSNTDFSEDPFTIMNSSEINTPNNDKVQDEKEFTLLPEKEAKLFRVIQKNYTRQQERKHILQKSGWDIDRIAVYVCELVGIEKDGLLKRSHNDKYTEAKALLSHWSYRELGIPMTTIGKYLELSNSVVSRLAERGRQITVKKKLILNSE